MADPEFAKRETADHNGVLGRNPHWGPRTEPLVAARGKALLKLETNIKDVNETV